MKAARQDGHPGCGETAGPLKDRSVVALDELDRMTRRQMCGVAATGLVALAVPSCMGLVVDDARVKARQSGPGGPGVGPGDEPEPPGGGPGTGGESGSGGDTGGAGGGGGEGGGAGGRGGSTRDSGPGGSPDGRLASDGGLDSRPVQVRDSGAPRLDAGGGSDATAAACGATSNTNMAPAAFRMNTATFFSAQRAFVCRDAGGLYALTSVCTHAGCAVRFVSSGSGFQCPCHGSQFNFVGSVTNGPAGSPLRHYEVCVGSDGNVKFDTSQTVNQSVRLKA